VQEWDCGPLKTEQFYAISEFKRILRKFQGVCGASVSVIYNLGRFTLWVSDLWGFKIMSVFPLNFQRPSAIYETIRRMRTRFKGASHVNVDHESTLTCLMWPPRLRGWYRSLMIIEKNRQICGFWPRRGHRIYQSNGIYTMGPLSRAKFGPDRGNVDKGAPKLKNLVNFAFFQWFFDWHGRHHIQIKL